MSDMTALLGAIEAFGEFGAEDLTCLDSALVVNEYLDGHHMTVQGKRASQLYIVLSGQVDVTRRGLVSGRERQVRTLERGALCGLQSLVNGVTEETTCTANGRVLVAEFSRQVCDMLMAQSASIAFQFKLMVGRQLARDLAERNRVMREQLAEL